MERSFLNVCMCVCVYVYNVRVCRFYFVIKNRGLCSPFTFDPQKEPKSHTQRAQARIAYLPFSYSHYYTNINTKNKVFIFLLGKKKILLRPLAHAKFIVAIALV